MCLAYLLAFTLGLGSRGVWIALAIGIALDALFMGLRWRSNAWLKVALHKTELYRQHLHVLPAQIQEQYLRDIRTPLMAHPSAQEQVDEAGVIYTVARPSR